MRKFAVANGAMAEWLGNGLQNRVQQFESAWYLHSGSLSAGGPIYESTSN